jgi:hypothetical protein
MKALLKKILAFFRLEEPVQQKKPTTKRNSRGGNNKSRPARNRKKVN